VLSLWENWDRICDSFRKADGMIVLFNEIFPLAWKCNSKTLHYWYFKERSVWWSFYLKVFCIYLLRHYTFILFLHQNCLLLNIQRQIFCAYSGWELTTGPLMSTPVNFNNMPMALEYADQYKELLSVISHQEPWKWGLVNFHYLDTIIVGELR
jgi:hypothetical protein